MAKRGAKPLPKFEEKTAELRSRMERIDLGVEEVTEKFRLPISSNNLRLKIKGIGGWNPGEQEEVERIINDEEQRIRELAAGF